MSPQSTEGTSFICSLKTLWYNIYWPVRFNSTQKYREGLVRKGNETETTWLQTSPNEEGKAFSNPDILQGKAFSNPDILQDVLASFLLWKDGKKIPVCDFCSKFTTGSCPHSKGLTLEIPTRGHCGEFELRPSISIDEVVEKMLEGR